MFAAGHISLAGWTLGLTAFFDVLDGTVARRTGQHHVFGAFYDSTLDRVADGFLFGGLTFFYASGTPHHSRRMVGVAMAGLLATFLTSYTRARAEALGHRDARHGIMERPERIALLAAPQAFFGLALDGWDPASRRHAPRRDRGDHLRPARPARPPSRSPDHRGRADGLLARPSAPHSFPSTGPHDRPGHRQARHPHSRPRRRGHDVHRRCRARPPRLSKPIGSLTQMATIRWASAPSAQPADSGLRAARGALGHRVRRVGSHPDDAYTAAVKAGVLQPSDLEPIADFLKGITPMPAVFESRYVTRLHGTNVKTGKNKRDLAEQLRRTSAT
jgi:hypothetical protein